MKNKLLMVMLLVTTIVTFGQSKKDSTKVKKQIQTSEQNHIQRYYVHPTFLIEATKNKNGKVDLDGDIRKWGEQMNKGLITNEEFTDLVLADQELIEMYKRK